MSIPATIPPNTPPLISSLDLQAQRVKDSENSILLKIASACIPGIGLMINQIQCRGIERKYKALALPKKFRPHPLFGNILDKNASSEEKKAACARAVQLKTIDRDYTKAALANNILTIALIAFAVAMNVLPFFAGAIMIGGFTFTAAVFIYVLCEDSSVERLKKYALELS